MSTTSSSLLAGAQADDDESWTRIVGLYAPLVLWWCRRRGLLDQDAQDVIQEVFKATFGRIKAFKKDGQPGAFRRWLCSVTRNKISDHYRRSSLPGSPVPDLPGPEPVDRDSSDLEADSERTIVLHRALEQLRDRFKPHTWDAMWMVVVEERNPEDVAVELGMTIGAVHTAKSRVLSRLRMELQGLFP